MFPVIHPEYTNKVNVTIGCSRLVGTGNIALGMPVTGHSDVNGLERIVDGNRDGIYSQLSCSRMKHSSAFWIIHLSEFYNIDHVQITIYGVYGI